ncbi:hypothetical protein OOK31_38595 [Streptomyces sp. NBC_00249]|uniref:hypothetical protein n=1 Tax=Streptomyces sp. NBC_00249 TaxID=2975690 RepID=UPI002259AABB|nr:hypothetical protein [Streptomyces sp. NBC_00249]MCX5199722.1 hypothetical protein [Streptomyces sp. NBC_00249]
MTEQSPADSRVHAIPGQQALRPAGPDGIDPSRARESVRRLYAGPPLTPADLSAPLLVLPDGHPGAGTLPGAVALTEVPATVTRWAGMGIRGVKLFAHGHDRDPYGTGALTPGNLMVRAIQAVKGVTANTVAVTTEVCGCSWTSTGECVLRTDTGAIDAEGTYALMRGMATQHAEAGADAVSPTAMLAGSVRTVRSVLDRKGHPDVGVNPNLAIRTGLYGPFKQLMDTEPARGDRRGLQLEPGRAERDTLVQARAWMIEGADSLTLQPVMTATDVLVRLRDITDAPIVAYSTSGEWAALQTLGIEGMAEYLAMLKRAGADTVLTFAAEPVATYLGGHRG